MTAEKFTMEDYKHLALRTKSPETPKSQQQLVRSWDLFRDIFEEVHDIAPVVDKLKRYGIYGKDDEDLEEQLPPVYPTGEKAERIRQCRDLIHGLIGIIGECGETAEELLRFINDGGELNLLNIQEEGSDKLWFLNLILTFAGSSIPQVGEANIRKLKRRYPNAFTLEDYTNRDKSAEMRDFKG